MKRFFLCCKSLLCIPSDLLHMTQDHKSMNFHKFLPKPFYMRCRSFSLLQTVAACLLCFMVVSVFMLGCFEAVSAKALPQTAAGTSDAFRTFASEAEGRYFTTTSEGTAVLELIPAFGRLFASVGLYMEENSLYSYYAAELIPVCDGQDQACGGIADVTSFDVIVRIFSNMSMAGNYWPGETWQRLTLIPGGLLLSNYSGTGDALISKGSTLLKRSGEVPGMFPYGSAETQSMAGGAVNTDKLAGLTGVMSVSWQEGGEETTVWLSLDPDGTILVLKDQGSSYPPLLLKGGYVVPEAEDGSLSLYYLMSSPSSGMMPYMGCVGVRIEGPSLVVTHLPESDDDLLLPMNAEKTVYYYH